MKTFEVEVEKRSVYQFGKRRRVVYDARLGDYRATEPTRAEAIARVRADFAYVAQAQSLKAHGCELFAQGYCSWVFRLPSGGCMCFSAADFAAALARVRSDYADHEGCKAFFACEATCGG